MIMMKCDICNGSMERLFKDEYQKNEMYVRKIECWMCRQCLFTIDIVRTRYANTILDEV